MALISNVVQGSNSNRLALLVHGYGADERDLGGLLTYLDPDGTLAAVFAEAFPRGTDLVEASVAIAGKAAKLPPDLTLRVIAEREQGTSKYMRLRRDELDDRFPGLLDAVLAEQVTKPGHLGSQPADLVITRAGLVAPVVRGTAWTRIAGDGDDRGADLVLPGAETGQGPGRHIVTGVEQAQQDVLAPDVVVTVGHRLAYGSRHDLPG